MLTDLLGAFVNGSSQGFTVIHGYAESLFVKLLIIELVLFGIGIALNRVDFKIEIVVKVLAIGFVQFLLFRYVWLVDGLRDGFVQAGLAAGGGHMSTAEFLDPSAYISSGLAKVYAVLESRSSDNGWQFLSMLNMIGNMNFIILIIMFFAFVAMGFQIFLAVLEFYIGTSLAIIMIPFLVLQKTSFLGSRALNGILSNCIKLMVLSFIASLAAPVLQELNFASAEPTLRESINLTVGAVAVALIMWRAPAIAMAFISGSSGLDFNTTVIQPVASAVSGAAGASRTVASAGGSAVLKTVAQAARSGANRVQDYLRK